MDDCKKVVYFSDNGIGTQHINAEKIFLQTDKQRTINLKSNIWFQVQDPITNFVGRDTELYQLHSLMLQHKKTVVCGLGGLGKTELARYYIAKHNLKYQNVVWINSETQESVADSFYKLAAEINVPIEYENIKRDVLTIVQNIYEVMCDTTCLLVFDNATSMRELSKYLPTSANNFKDIYVIVTSQIQEWDNIDRIQLGELNKADAVQLLCRSLNQKMLADKAERLARKLEYFPLALQQAIAYIKDQNMYEKSLFTVKDYLDLYEEEEVKLINFTYNGKPFPEWSNNDYNKTIYIIVQLTIKTIKNKERNFDLALKILNIISYFAPDFIPVKLLFPLQPEMRGDKLVRNAIRILSKYSIINMQGKETIHIHRLIQQTIRSEMNRTQDESYYQELALRLVLKLKFSAKTHSARVLKHLDRKLDLINSVYRKSSESTQEIILMLLTCNGHVNSLKSIIESLNLFKKNSIDYRILINAAAESGHIHIIEMLTSIIEVDNLEAFCGYSIMHRAARNGHLDVVKFLVRQGVSITSNVDSHPPPLLEAIRGGHVSVVTFFVEQGVSVKEQIWRSQTPLHIATHHHHANILEYLIKWGASVLEVDENGELPLHFALRKKYWDIVKLLTHEETVNVRTKRNEYPLHIVLERYQVDIAKYFINKRVNVDQTNSNGETALHIALRKQLYDIVKLLIDKSSDINQLDKYGKSPLYLAAANGDYKSVQALVNTGKIVQKRSKYNALHAAVENNHRDVVKFLINYVSHVDETNNFRQTAMHVAARAGNLNIARYLRNKDGMVNCVDAFNRTPLHEAAEQGHFEVTRYLIQQSANPNIKENLHYQTPIYLAAKNGHKYIVKLFFRELKLDVPLTLETVCASGRTLLFAAVSSGNLKLVKHLIQRGAKVNHQDKNNLTALDVAVEDGCLEIVDLLLNNGVDIKDKYNTLVLAASLGHLDIVIRFLDRGLDVNAPDNWNDFTALHRAAANGHLKVVKCLVNRGASVEKRTQCNGSYTPLYCAVQNGHVAIAEFLLERDADPDDTDHRGNTVLHEAVERGYLEMVKCLIVYHADPNKNSGNSPLCTAVKENHLEIARCLIENNARIDHDVLLLASRNRKYWSEIIPLQPEEEQKKVTRHVYS